MSKPIDPMESVLLTKECMPYDVWHYIVMLEWGTMNTMLGFAFDKMEYAYHKGYTPRRYITEAFASAVMTAVDAQPAFFQWLNKHANRPGEFNELTQGKSCEIRVGRDARGWLLQVYYLGACIGTMRFDHRAPPPPGWVGK